MQKILLWITIPIIGSFGLFPINADEIVENPPGNMTEFTCTDFKVNADKCISYSCQTASNVDPSTTISWKIIGSQNNRCLISSTTNDVGLKDDNGNPKPITKTCEYDDAGVNHLEDLMDQLENEYFNPESSAFTDGTYNCQITSNDEPLTGEPDSSQSDD